MSEAYWKERAERLEAALQNMAKQRKSDEWDEASLCDLGFSEGEDVRDLDWEGGFDIMVDNAREALAPQDATPPQTAVYTGF